MDANPCPSGGPSMNTDVSGIGVRVSFYLQTLFLSGLAARSNSLEEITGALYTLIITNTAMAVTALILGLKPTPEISFHDALVVFYLLFLSWVTVFFSLPACARLDLSSTTSSTSIKLLHLFSVVQSYTIFAFALAMLITAPTFGSPSSIPCNPNAVVVLFRPFKALHTGRILGLIATGLVIIAYTGVLVKDHVPSKKQIRQWMQRRVTKQVPATEKDKERGAEAPEPPIPLAPAPELLSPPQPRTRNAQTGGQYRARKPQEKPAEYDLQIAWHLVIELFVVLVIWALAVMNTELLIRWNHFAPSSGTSWQFGQVLPMFLVLLPLANLVGAFRELGLRPAPPRTPPATPSTGHGAAPPSAATSTTRF